MTAKYEYVKKWHQRTKQKLIEMLGGKCRSCGYNRCSSALEFHHVDPDEKDFSISKWRQKSWEILVNEIKKCVLLCSNCHREVHAGLQKCPKIIFNDKGYRPYDSLIKAEKRKCICCNKEYFGLSGRKYCSQTCSKKNSEKIDWPTNNQLKQMIKNANFVKVAKQLGVTDNAVRKRLKNNAR